MGARERRAFSQADVEQIWCGWRAGQSQAAIARSIGRVGYGVRWVLRAHGGIAPVRRSRAHRQLSVSQREEISRGLSEQVSMRCIAGRIGVHPSTVSREIRRNGGRAAYRAVEADHATWERARRAKLCLLQRDTRVRHYVVQSLRQQWSPEQIARRLQQHYPNDKSMRVSHETIYRSLYIQARGVLKKELTQHLRTARQMRHSRHATRKGTRGRIVDAVSISQRPAEAADRAVPGHWEGDLISGSANTYIATLVERHSRFVLLAKVASKETHEVVAALTKKMSKLPVQLRRSLTWDRGLEMGNHKDFTIATDMQVYFCDPQSPWQRGSNENTNGLLRQYFPKGTDLSVHSQAHLDAIARRLNGRPRETLNFRTPAEKLSDTVASIS